MSIQIHEAKYVPDLDGVTTPGALTDMSGFAPLQRGPYGSVRNTELFALTAEKALHAETFRKTNGDVRLLVFTAQNIDEYDNAGTKTNVGSGYNALTAQWSASSWGDYIIACNKLDAVQYSTGTSFTALPGTPPKARYVASNINFVMLADTDDGADDLADRVWWSALQNPEDWTPSIATQCGYYRLADAPGPIRQLVAFRDQFVAFKDDAVFVGEYIGPPFIFQWRLVSSRVGLAASNGVCEMDEALYFVHTSGFYKWDGASLTNIGMPVFNTFLNAFDYTTMRITGYPPYGETGTDFPYVRAVGDDIEGVVWWSCYTTAEAPGTVWNMYLFGYNVRSNKWAKAGRPATEGVINQPLVSTTHSDMRVFWGASMAQQARVWYIDNRSPTAGLWDLRYPDAWDMDTLPASVTTGIQGSPERSSDLMRIYPRCLNGSNATPFGSCTIYGYANEQRNVGAQTAVATVNPELDCFDGRLSSRFRLVYLEGSREVWCYLAGIGVEFPPTGGR